MLSFCYYFYSSYNVFSNTLSASKLTKSCFCLSPSVIYRFYHILCLLSYFLAYRLLFDLLKKLLRYYVFVEIVNYFCFLETFWISFKQLFINFSPVNFYVSISHHMIGLWHFILPIMWGHLWWLFFIINLISLKIIQILRDVQSWVYLPWHFQGQFSYMSCELVNESSIGGFIIPLLGGDERHRAGLIGGSRHLWHIFEAIFCPGFFCLHFSAFCLSGTKEKPLPTLLTSSYFI